MKWKLELDALIESTMAFAKDIKRGQPIADLPVAKRTAEQALADTSTPIPPPTTIAPTVVLPASQRDEIRQRVSSFKTHQEKIAGTRGILCWRPSIRPAFVPKSILASPMIDNYPWY